MASPPYDAEILDTVVVVGANITEHFPPLRVQLVEENVPAPPVLVNVRVPVGVDVGAGLVSATVAVHVEDWPIGKDAGAQLTVVEVVRRVTVNGNVPLLGLWPTSPLYVPVII